MATYPIKMLKDEKNQPFVPLVSTDCIRDENNQTLQQVLDKKLSPTNLLPGEYVSITTEGNNCYVNVDLPANLNIINNLTTSSAGQGALDAYQGKILKDSIPQVINDLSSTSTINALSANQGYILNNKFANYLSLNGGTMNGEIAIGQGDGYGIQLNTNGRINATLDGQSNATVLGILDASVLVGHTSAPLLLRGKNSTPLYNGVALVESGSNSNGSYIKLVDGTMICYHTKNVTVECTSQWGVLYEGGTAVGNLPATFISTPIVIVSNTSPDGYFEGIRGTTTTTWGTLRMAIPTSSTRAFTVNFLAIGKWK